MARARSEDFKTPPCHIAFANGLFTARSTNNGAPKFGCTLIFPKTIDRSVLDNACREAIVAEWGEKGLEKVKAGIIKTPFLDGNGKEARSKKTGELYTGMGPDVFFIRPSANADRPPVLRYKSSTILAQEAEIYSGCIGFAVLNAFTWHNDQSGDGVSFGIQYFQRTGDGERWGGGGEVDADRWHEKVADAGPAPAAAASGAGAGGLFG